MGERKKREEKKGRRGEEGECLSECFVEMSDAFSIFFTFPSISTL